MIPKNQEKKWDIEDIDVAGAQVSTVVTIPPGVGVPKRGTQMVEPTMRVGTIGTAARVARRPNTVDSPPAITASLAGIENNLT